jgi:hypothetical protein
LAYPRRLGDNAGMARDDSRARLRRVASCQHLRLPGVRDA